MCACVTDNVSITLLAVCVCVCVCLFVQLCHYVCVCVTDSVTITPQDSRWVGAWWLGYVVAGVLSLITALPFWFLPRSLPEDPQISQNQNLNHYDDNQDPPALEPLTPSQQEEQEERTPNLTEVAKGKDM